MEYAGTSLSDLNFQIDDLSQLEIILPQYAEIQMELSVRQNKLIKIGVPDRRLDVLPSLYSMLLKDKETIVLC